MIKKIILALILLGAAAMVPVLYFAFSQGLTSIQIKTLLVCLIVCGASVFYCFVVGELTKNNSQMDKLWSILPEVYLWIMFFIDASARGSISIRLLVMAILGTLWGIRLTINFALKGAYSLRFWSGEEDYRWKILRSNKMFEPRYRWVLFNFFFISLYQNVLILLTTFPGLVSIGSDISFNYLDTIASILVVAFLTLETIADIEQWKFQSTKYRLLNEGHSLNELPLPYQRGFNTVGLWNYMRHPNYLGEQGIWISMFLFSVSAMQTFNWSYLGGLLLILLFLGSSSLAENISKGKYPEYENYQKKVFMYLPLRRYR